MSSNKKNIKEDEYGKDLFFKELDRLDHLSESERGEGGGDGSRSQNRQDFGIVFQRTSKEEVAGQTSGFRVDGRASTSLDGGSLSRRDSDLGSMAHKEVSGSGLGPVSGSNKVIGIGNSSPSSRITSERGSSSKMPTMKRANKTTGSSGSEGIKITTTDRSSALKKRRTYTSKTVPEDQQIFKGLSFFFFPNNDISPLRRLRIQRAQEYGALWTKTWGQDITHVVVDKGLVFKDILTFLNIDSFPSSVAVVDECYPSECIKFRSVLSTTHARFRVNGTPTESKESSSRLEEVPSKSLPVQPVARLASSPIPQPIDSGSEPSPPPNQQVCGLQVKEKEEVTVSDAGPTSERDALDDIIDEAKAVKDLPLDPLDGFDEENSPEESDSDSAETSEAESGKRKRRKSARKDNETVDWQQKFACMQKHDQTSSSGNPNIRTIEVLQQMLDYYTRTSDHWRVIAYRKAISALRRQPKKIASRTQAFSIPGIGQRLADKIEEIVWTNRLRRLENANCTPEDRILQEFLGVYGVGVSQASKWVAQGYKTLEDLRTKAPLTKNQKIGVERYHDFSQRIPRQEVAAHGEIVRKAVQKVDPGMQVIISGSYRRGAPDCGDIDVLITKPDATIEQIRTIMTDTVVPELFQQGFLQASLAITSRGDGSKWHGASMLPGSNFWRRIDLLFVPGSEIGAALIYFTGNDIFNRSMRLLASKKGMCLNQRGLYTDVLRGEKRVKLARRRLVEGRDEKRIFEILGVPWRPPEHRIC